ncbi:NAD(P)-dependent oxidoreductase [Marinobacter sp. X15-166B]|uniref:NAD(P)-dependent oxidoreductase n=1 Tax=Marinobacter sp. X15-166B TaxID=1897620 RepID=UPI00085BD246|nr:NAD(P)-dependent oxidoreductase [Marinobacter sp. X15-166B]OEY67493.1 2-hydroxy-3-oxopropionate reductase [Marinobacter sp. X15-166B]
MNDNKTQRIGMIGIGLMGQGIAGNILHHGWTVGFLEHPGNQPTDHLVAEGAIAYASGSELATASDVIILCVTGTPQVEDALLRADGVLSGLRPGTVIIDCSTAIPGSTVKLAQTVAAAGGAFLDAPMTRTPKEAAEGRLNLIVGGDRALFDEQLPLLESFSENITYAGPVGSGHTLKLLHNFVSLGFSTVLAEAAACAEKGGIEPGVLVEVLAAGGGAGAILQRLQPYILARDSSGFKFSIANAHKDIGYYVAMAESLEAEDRAARGIFAVLSGALESGFDQASIPELMAVLNGQPLSTADQPVPGRSTEDR